MMMIATANAWEVIWHNATQYYKASRKFNNQRRSIDYTVISMAPDKKSMVLKRDGEPVTLTEYRTNMAIDRLISGKGKLHYRAFISPVVAETAIVTFLPNVLDWSEEGKYVILKNRKER